MFHYKFEHWVGKTLYVAKQSCHYTQKMLKIINKKRSEATVEKALVDQGKTFIGLWITEILTCINDTMKTNEEYKWCSSIKWSELA
jgi:hypothetical protein